MKNYLVTWLEVCIASVCILKSYVQLCSSAFVLFVQVVLFSLNLKCNAILAGSLITTSCQHKSVEFLAGEVVFKNVLDITCLYGGKMKSFVCVGEVRELSLERFPLFPV